MTKYIPLILIEGATVMAVELCGAKMLTPLFGGSLFVWAAILAVTLAALAFGYYWGGVFSGKNDPEKKLFLMIIWASATTLLMPFLTLYVIPPVSYLEFKWAVILSACILIFAPIFFLGCTTPLLIRINTTSTDVAGVVSGKIYAISTIGGIVSTLLCGFVLIPNIGLKLTLIVFAIILFVVAAVILKLFKPGSSIPFFIALILGAKTLSGGYMDIKMLYFEYGMMGDVAVIEDPKEEIPTRKLLVNKIVQTEMDLKTKRSTSFYIHCIDSMLNAVEKKRRGALVLGLGGGLLANTVQKKGYDVVAVEFDSRITDAAKNFFYLDPEIEIHTQDARAYINQSTDLYTSIPKYETIILDVFKGEEQPYHVITSQSFEKLAFLLDDHGTMFINWHGYLDGELGKGTQILLNTLHFTNFSTTIIKGPGEPDNRNLLIVCKKGNGSGCGPDDVINTDDQPVIELANAKANLRWRQNYLRFYQSSR